MKPILYVILALTLCGAASATTYTSGTVFNATSINHTLTATYDLVADRLEVTANSIEFQNLSYTAPTGYEGSFFYDILNITVGNISATGYDLPLVNGSVSSLGTKYITCQNENGTFNVTNLTITTPYANANKYLTPYINISTADGTYHQNLSYTKSGTTALVIHNVPVTCPATGASANKLMIFSSSPTQTSDDLCNNLIYNGMSGMKQGVTLIAVVVLAAVALIIVVGFMAAKDGNNAMSGIRTMSGDNSPVTLIIMAVVGIAVALFIMIFIALMYTQAC